MISFAELRAVNRRARKEGSPTMSRVDASILLEIRKAECRLSGVELMERLPITFGQAFQALKFLTAAGYLDTVPA